MKSLNAKGKRRWEFECHNPKANSGRRISFKIILVSSQTIDISPIRVFMTIYFKILTFGTPLFK